MVMDDFHDEAEGVLFIRDWASDARLAEMRRALAISFNDELEGAMARAVEVLLLAVIAALLRSWLSRCWRSN